MATTPETKAEVATSAPSSTQWRLKACRNSTKIVVARNPQKALSDDQKSPTSADEECKTFQDEASRNDNESHHEESSELGEEAIRRRSSYDKREAAKHYNIPPRSTGVVVKFTPQRGYGFIRPDCDYSNGAQRLPDVFVHRTSIVSINKVPNLRVGQSCEYDVTLDPRTGKPHAVNVTITSASPHEAPPVKSMTRQNERMSNVLRNKSNNEWPSPSMRKMERITPLKNLPKQSFPQKAENSDAWSRPRMFDEKELPKRAWNAPGERIDFPTDMNMTVTIDNEYSYRSDSIPPNWAHYHQDYPNQINWNDPKRAQHYTNHPSKADYPSHDSVLGGARKNLGAYDDYSRQEYWYCDQEKRMAHYNRDYQTSMMYHAADYPQYDKYGRW